jgi:hypothetical protein
MSNSWKDFQLRILEGDSSELNEWFILILFLKNSFE